MNNNTTLIHAQEQIERLSQKDPYIYAFLVPQEGSACMIYAGQRYLVTSFRIQYPENDQPKQLQYCAVKGLQKLNTFDNQVVLLERKKNRIIITIIDMASQHILYCSEDEQFSNHYGWLTCLLNCAHDLYYIAVTSLISRSTKVELLC